MSPVVQSRGTFLCVSLSHQTHQHCFAIKYQQFSCRQIKHVCALSYHCTIYFLNVIKISDGVIGAMLKRWIKFVIFILRTHIYRAKRKQIASLNRKICIQDVTNVSDGEATKNISRNFNRNWTTFIPKNEVGNIVCTRAAILSPSQCVDKYFLQGLIYSDRGCFMYCTRCNVYNESLTYEMSNIPQTTISNGFSWTEMLPLHCQLGNGRDTTILKRENTF